MSQQPPLLCSEPLPHIGKVYVKKGSCLQHMPLGRQKQQTNLCHNRKRRIVSFTQPWRCGTSNAAIPLDLSPLGETEKRLLSQTRRGQGLLIPHVICTEACSSCAVLIPCFPLTSAYSPVMPSLHRAPICLDCVTVPPPVLEPWGASRHGQSAGSLQGAWEEEK